jgi:hypothetical protein
MKLISNMPFLDESKLYTSLKITMGEFQDGG